MKVSCDPAYVTKNHHFLILCHEGQLDKKRDTGKRQNVLARNASWPDNPRSAARRAAQDLVCKINGNYLNQLWQALRFKAIYALSEPAGEEEANTIDLKVLREKNTFALMQYFSWYFEYVIIEKYLQVTLSMTPDDVVQKILELTSWKASERLTVYKKSLLAISLLIMKIGL